MIEPGKGLLEIIREQGNVYKHESRELTVNDIEELFKNLNKQANRKRTRTLPAIILLASLEQAKNNKDLKSINRMYKDYEFLGGEETLNPINKRIKELENIK